MTYKGQNKLEFLSLTPFWPSVMFSGKASRVHAIQFSLQNATSWWTQKENVRMRQNIKWKNMAVQDFVQVSEIDWLYFFNPFQRSFTWNIETNCDEKENK